MKLRFVGCGDAFGSGGRFNTCFMVERQPQSFLIDCGASTLIAMRKLGLEPNAIGSIFISHLHGDHFGELPFFILDAQFYSRRQSPLTIVGPPGLERRLQDAMEVFFPGSASAQRKFDTVIREIEPGAATEVGDVEVTAIEVRHACGAPALGLRLRCEGKVIAYSGDSEWTDALIETGRGADLFIAEALTFERRIPQHLDYASLVAHQAAIGARRTILTHLGPDMLQRASQAEHEIAADGLVLEI
jgi:ribonuclease BN (tRNA processing enzyme)